MIVSQCTSASAQITAAAMCAAAIAGDGSRSSALPEVTTPESVTQWLWPARTEAVAAVTGTEAHANHTCRANCPTVTATIARAGEGRPRQNGIAIRNPRTSPGSTVLSAGVAPWAECAAVARAHVSAPTMSPRVSARPVSTTEDYPAISGRVGGSRASRFRGQPHPATDRGICQRSHWSHRVPTG